MPPPYIGSADVRTGPVLFEGLFPRASVIQAVADLNRWGRDVQTALAVACLVLLFLGIGAWLVQRLRPA